MAQYYTSNVKLPNSQVKSGTKNSTEVTLNLSSNVIGDDEINFPNQVLLTNTQVSEIRKGFAND